MFGVYSFKGDGEPMRIGETEDTRLRADADAAVRGLARRRRATDRGGDLRPVQRRNGCGASRPSARTPSRSLPSTDGRAYLAEVDEHRTVRRRRVASGVAGVAVLAVVATSAALLGGDGENKTDFVDDPLPTDVPMWTEGSVLHTPGRTFDLGVDVASFVRTSEGIVFLGWDDNEAELFDVYSFTGDGMPEIIGETQDSRLRADAAQPYAGWLDGSGEDVDAVIFDQDAEERIWSEPTKRAYSFPIVAIDGTSAYLAKVDEGPVQILDLESGGRTDLPADPVWRNFVAVEGDLVARMVDSGNHLEVGDPDGDGVVLAGQGADGAVFSPDGRWISPFSGSVRVYDTTTGDPVAVDTLGFADGAGYEWLDADTLLAIGASDTGDDIVLMSCEIPAGTCTEVARLDGFEAGEIYAFGLGEAIWEMAGESSGSDSVTVEATEVAPPEAD